jgi:hypothetical protein
MADLNDLVNALIAMVPDDGGRITNDEIRADLEREAGEPISDGVLKEIKNHVVALGAAEAVKGPGGGLRAPGSTPPPRMAATTPPSAVAPGTTAASVLTGELRNQIDRHLGCLLERRHRQPIGGAGAAHLPAVHPPAG